MKKITGLKKAVGEYKAANEGGFYSPMYGRLMFDRETGKLLTDTFYSIGHNDFAVYHDAAVVNIGAELAKNDETVTMQTVKNFITAAYPEYKA